MHYTRRQFASAVSKSALFIGVTTEAVGNPQDGDIKAPLGSDEGQKSAKPLEADQVPVGVFVVRTDARNVCYVSEGFGNKGGGRYRIKSSIVKDNKVIKKPVIAIVNQSNVKLEVLFYHKQGKQIFKDDTVRVNPYATEFAKIKDKTDSQSKFPEHDSGGLFTSKKWKPEMTVAYYVNDVKKTLPQCDIRKRHEHSDIVIEC